LKSLNYLPFFNLRVSASNNSLEDYQLIPVRASVCVD